MMYRAIDPDGLTHLADALETATGTIRNRSRVALDLLNSNGRGDEALGVAAGEIENWSGDTVATLRWRAEAIRSGQRYGVDIVRLMHAGFAAEAVFSLADDGFQDAYRRWITEVRARQERVAAAVADITSWLDQGWTDWDVTSGDLHNIWATLQDLSGEELDHVIAALTPSQLRRWVEEMGNQVNGFSRDEKRGVWTMLAAKSSGGSLDRVHQAIVASGTQNDAVDLGMAIRAHTPDIAIADFVVSGVGRHRAGQRFSGVAPALAIAGITDTATLDRAVGAITGDKDTLPPIVVDGLTTARIEETDTACIEINPLDSAIDAISRGTDPEAKTVAFTIVTDLATGAQSALRELLRTRRRVADAEDDHLFAIGRDDHAARDLLRAAQLELLGDATQLLVADAAGVITELATRSDPEGAATTAYLQALVEHHQIDWLGRVVAAVRQGEAVDQVAFSTYGTDPDYRYPHAQNLAFLAGTLNNALARYAAEAKSQITRISLGAALGSLFVGPLYQGATYTANLLATGLGAVGDGMVSSVVGSGVEDDIDDHLARVIGLVELSLQPQPSRDRPPVQMGEAPLWWHHRYRMIRGLEG